MIIVSVLKISFIFWRKKFMLILSELPNIGHDEDIRFSVTREKSQVVQGTQ